MLNCFQYYYPESLHSIHVINAPFMFDSLWNLIKPIISKELSSKIFFRPSLDLSSIMMEFQDCDLSDPRNLVKNEEDIAIEQESAFYQGISKNFKDLVMQFEGEDNCCKENVLMEKWIVLKEALNNYNMKREIFESKQK